MKIIRRDYGQGSQDEEQKISDGSLIIDRLIYRKLGSWTENKIVTEEEKDKGDYGRFLTDISDYYDGGTPTAALAALDEALSVFNYTDERFPFNDYYETSPPFDNLEPYNPTKNIIHSGQNIVHGSSNIVHNTEG